MSVHLTSALGAEIYAKKQFGAPRRMENNGFDGIGLDGVFVIQYLRAVKGAQRSKGA